MITGTRRAICPDCGTTFDRPLDGRFSGLCPDCRRLHKSHGGARLSAMRLGKKLPPGPFVVVSCPDMPGLVGRIISRFQLATDLCLGLRTEGERLACRDSGRVVQVLGAGAESAGDQGQQARRVLDRDLTDLELRRAKAYRKRRIA